MKEEYSEPWFPKDEKVKEIFLNTNKEDLKKVSEVLNNVQTFIPIINPVFALVKNWKIALVSPETLNENIEDWDECFFSRLENLKSEFNDQEFYWTCLSDLKDLSQETYSYQKFYPCGVAKAPLTLDNYIRFRSSLPYVCTETIICFNSSLDILVYQISGEFILVATDMSLMKKLFTESNYKGWSVLDSGKFFYGDLKVILSCARAIYNKHNMTFKDY